MSFDPPKEIDLESTDRLPILQGISTAEDVEDSSARLEFSATMPGHSVVTTPTPDFRPSGLDLPSLAESVRSVEERIARQNADYEALNRLYERARDSQLAAGTRADALASELGAAQSALAVEQHRVHELQAAVAETNAASEQTRARAEEAKRKQEAEEKRKQAAEARIRFATEHHVLSFAQDAGAGARCTVSVTPYTTKACRVIVRPPGDFDGNRRPRLSVPCGTVVQECGASLTCDCSNPVEPDPCWSMDVRSVPFGYKDAGVSCGGVLSPPDGHDPICSTSLGELDHGVYRNGFATIPFGGTSEICGQRLDCACDFFRVPDAGTAPVRP